MDEKNFEELLDLHGSDLSTWPELLQNEARNLLSVSPAAQASLDAQVDADHVLVDVMVVPTTYGLEQKIMSRFTAQKRRFELRTLRTLLWKPAFAATCSLVFGIYLGAANQEPPSGIAEDLTYVTFYDYEEWSGDVEDEP